MNFPAPRKLFIYLFLLCPFHVVLAQINRSTPPEPGPAPEIRVGSHEKFILDNGMRVYVVEDHKLPRVSYTLIFDNDPVLEGEHAGYVGFTGELLGTATTTRSKAEIDEAIDFMGAKLSTSSGSVHASCLKKHNEKLLEILSDILIHPVFKPEELEKVRKQTLSALAAEKNDPDAIAGKVSDLLVYGKNHPYGEFITEQTVNTIITGMCRQYYEDYMTPASTYLAIVGDINKREARKLIMEHFGEWKGTLPPEHRYQTPESPPGKQVVVVDRPVAVQSVVIVAYPVQLKPGSKNTIPAKVMNTILGGGVYRLFENLREKHGYTYGAYSSLQPDPLTGSFQTRTEVRTSVTDSAIHEILYEMNRLRDESVQEEELERVKNYLSGSFALALENPRTVARFAINTERYDLPGDYYTNYLKTIHAVNPPDVQAMAQKYLKPEHSYILVVGKAGEISDRLKKFSDNGSILYHDTDGNPLPSPGDSLSFPAGITADAVIDRYIEVTGGKPAYEIEIIDPAGNSSLEYFDQETGLKIKAVQTQEAPSGPVTQETWYEDYRKNSGVLFPYTIRQTANGQTFDIKVDSIKVNTGIPDEIFQ